MNEQAIVVHNLTRDFGAVRALNEMSFSVPPGIIFGFLGANGAGKTTMIRVLLGLLEPTAGEATVLGLNARTQSAQIREQAGALLEYTGLYERLTAYDNLDFYGRVWRMAPAERAARIQELLQHFDLWDRRGERVGTWSRGMKQKVAIARALLHRPRIVFLDEPTAGLDPVAAAGLRNDLAALAAREGVTIFLTTHNLDEAERLCALVGVIRRGTLLALGSPQQLRTQGEHPRVTIRGQGFTEAVVNQIRTLDMVNGVTQHLGSLEVELRDNATAAPIVSALVHAGADIEEVQRNTASLEDVFLTLMQERDPATEGQR